MAKRKPRRRRKRARVSSPRTPAARLSAQELEIERLVREARTRAEEAYSPETPVERVAALLVENFERLPSPLGLRSICARPGRASAPERWRRRCAASPRERGGADLQAEVARVLDGTPSAPRRCSTSAPAARDPGRDHRAGRNTCSRPTDARGARMAEEALVDDPHDKEAQERRAGRAERIHRRAQAGGRLDPWEQAALARFLDRRVPDRLRAGVREYVASRPDLDARSAETLREWLETRAVEETARTAALLERAGSETSGWRSPRGSSACDGACVGALSSENETGTGPRARDSGTAARAVRGEAGLLRNSHAPPQSCSETHLLWLLAGRRARSRSGPVVTDLGLRLPPPRRDRARAACDLARWSVLLGPLAGDDGTCGRPAPSSRCAHPRADSAAQLAPARRSVELAQLLAASVRGGRRRQTAPERPRRAGAQGPARPLPPTDEQGVGNLLPGIANELGSGGRPGGAPEHRRHRLRLITAKGRGERPPPWPRHALAATPDFSARGSGELIWWGRELTSWVARESAIAHLRRPQAGPDETPRLARPARPARQGPGRVELNHRRRSGSTSECDSRSSTQRPRVGLDLNRPGPKACRAQPARAGLHRRRPAAVSEDAKVRDRALRSAWSARAHQVDCASSSD